MKQLIKTWQKEKALNLSNQFSNVHVDLNAVNSRLEASNSNKDIIANGSYLQRLESEFEIEERRLKVAKQVKKESWLR